MTATSNAAVLADIRLAADAMRMGLCLVGRGGSMSIQDGRFYFSPDGVTGYYSEWPLLGIKSAILRHDLNIMDMVQAAVSLNVVKIGWCDTCHRLERRELSAGEWWCAECGHLMEPYRVEDMETWE